MPHILVLACNPTHLEQENSFSVQGQSRVHRKNPISKTKNKNGKRKSQNYKKKSDSRLRMGRTISKLLKKPTLHTLTFESLRQDVM